MRMSASSLLSALLLRPPYTSPLAMTTSAAPARIVGPRGASGGDTRSGCGTSAKDPAGMSECSNVQLRGGPSVPPDGDIVSASRILPSREMSDAWEGTWWGREFKATAAACLYLAAARAACLILELAEAETSRAGCLGGKAGGGVEDAGGSGGAAGAPAEREGDKGGE